MFKKKKEQKKTPKTDPILIFILIICQSLLIHLSSPPLCLNWKGGVDVTKNKPVIESTSLCSTHSYMTYQNKLSPCTYQVVVGVSDYATKPVWPHVKGMWFREKQNEGSSGEQNISLSKSSRRLRNESLPCINNDKMFLRKSLRTVCLILF